MLRLKELRIATGKNQKEMAKELNLTKSTYNYWENGKIEIDFKSLIMLADYFGVSVDYLLGRENKSTDLSQDEWQLLTYFKQCDVIDQTYLLERAKLLAEGGNKNVSLEKVKKYWNLAVKRIIIYAPYYFSYYWLRGKNNG